MLQQKHSTACEAGGIAHSKNSRDDNTHSSPHEVRGILRRHDEHSEGAHSQTPFNEVHPDLSQTCRSDRDPQDVAWSSRLRFCSSADPSGKTRFNMFERPEPSWKYLVARALVLLSQLQPRSTRSDDISKRPEPCVIPWVLGRRVCRSALPYGKPRLYLFVHRAPNALRASDAPHGAYLDDCCHRRGAIEPIRAQFASLLCKKRGPAFTYTFARMRFAHSSSMHCMLDFFQGSFFL